MTSIQIYEAMMNHTHVKISEELLNRLGVHPKNPIREPLVILHMGRYTAHVACHDDYYYFIDDVQHTDIELMAGRCQHPRPCHEK